MFDGSLFVEMIRARILLELAESKPWRRALSFAGDILIALGQRLKAHVQPLPPAYTLVEHRKHKQ